MDVKNIGGNREEFVKANDGEYYRNNCELRNGEIICSERNVIINNGYAHKLPDTCRLIDNYIFDRDNTRIISAERYVTEQETRAKIIAQNGSASTPQAINQQVSYFMKENFKENDAFLNSLGKINGFKISKLENGENLISIETEKGENVELTYGKHDQITSVRDQNSVIIGDNYLDKSKGIKEFSVPNAKHIGDRVLLNAHSLETLDAKNAGSIGEHSFTATHLRELDVPNLRNLGYGAFAIGNFCSINAPKLENMWGSNFFAINSQKSFAKTVFDSAKLPDQIDAFNQNPSQFIDKVVKNYLGIGISSPEDIKALPKEALTVVDLNNLSQMGSGCFYETFDLKKLNVPKLGPASHKPDLVLCSKKVLTDYETDFKQGEIFSPKSAFEEELFAKCVNAVADYQQMLLEQDNDSNQLVETQPETIQNSTRPSLSAQEAQDLLKSKFVAKAKDDEENITPVQDDSKDLCE